MAIDAISRLDAVPGRFGGKRRWVNWSFTHRDDWRRVQREDLVTIGGHLAYQARDGRLVVCDKRPCDPRSGRPAKVNDPGTWGTLEEARAMVAEGRAEGVAYALDEDEVLIDLDGCIDDQGQVSAAARVVVEKLDSYTERSVSGRGLHVLCVAPDFRCTRGNRAAGMEVYDRSRFAIVTGDVYEGHGELALDCADVLEDLYQAEFAERAPRETRVEPREEIAQRVSDEHAVCWLIAHYRQGRTLFERGDLMRWEQARRRYDQKADLSRSVADYSLAVMLLAATDGCQEQAVRLMRRSALARPKYEEVHDGVRPYVEMTVANAAARMDPAIERARAIERGNEYLEAHYPSDARRLVELMRRDEVTHWQLRTYLCSQALVDVRVGRRDGCESFPLAWLVDRWEEVSAALYRYDFERVVQEG